MMFCLTYAWETVQEAGSRLGLTELGDLSIWIAEECNRGNAEGNEIQDPNGWILPVFRKATKQTNLFDSL